MTCLVGEQEIQVITLMHFPQTCADFNIDRGCTEEPLLGKQVMSRIIGEEFITLAF